MNAARIAIARSGELRLRAGPDGTGLTRRSWDVLNARLGWVRVMNERRRTGRPMQCRVCGCSDARACTGGCGWIDLDLCSRCADFEDMPFGLIIDVANARGVPLRLINLPPDFSIFDGKKPR